MAETRKKAPVDYKRLNEQGFADLPLSSVDHSPLRERKLPTTSGAFSGLQEPAFTSGDEDDGEEDVRFREEKARLTARLRQLRQERELQALRDEIEKEERVIANNARAEQDNKVVQVHILSDSIAKPDISRLSHTEHQTMALTIVDNYIDGQFVKCDRCLDSFDPATGEVWAKIPDSGQNEVEAAVTAAKLAFPKWSDMPIQERSKIMHKIADILESRLDEFADVESRDQGKPVWLAKSVDIPRAVFNMRFFATSALHDLNRSNQMQAVDAFNYTIKMPVGVAGLISPWNLPLYLLTFKLAPAIICGNTVVAKPSEMTSVTAWMLADVFNAAGLPPGVVNFVFGSGPRAGEPIVKHPDVPIVSFTGGTATAVKLRLAAAPYSKKMSLELGGKNPGIIFADADMDKCIPTTIRSSFMNQGEICLCTSRLFVQRSVFQQFVDRFVKETRKLRVGDRKDPDTFMGALISQGHLTKVKGYVDIAREEGGSILCGEEDLNLPDNLKNGYFMRPTVISGLTDSSRLMTEEIFGPVVCVVPFDTADGVIDRANSVRYGLAASVWSTNVSTLHKVSQKLHAGTVWANCWMVRDLNMPFGGMKESGTGRESAKDSIEFFTEEKTICVKL